MHAVNLTRVSFLKKRLQAYNFLQFLSYQIITCTIENNEHRFGWVGTPASYYIDPGSEISVKIQGDNKNNQTTDNLTDCN
jgi:hypothetical protein